MRQTRLLIVLAACAAALTGSLAAQVVAVPPTPPPAPGRIETVTGQTRAGGQPAVAPKPLVANSVIVGRVVDPSTQRGVGGVVVTLNGGPARAPGPIAGPQPVAVPPQILTDSDGRFAFRPLTRGNYTLNATKSGYSAGAFGRMRPGGPTRPVQLDDGEKLNDVTIRIFKLGSISGQVVDEAGEPVVGAQVRLYRRMLVSGRRVLAQSAGATTDDRGIYRASGLTPAEYVVVVPMVPASVPAGGQPNAAARQNLQATSQQLSFAAASAGSGGRQLTANAQFLLQSSGSAAALAAVEDGAGRWRAYPTQYYPNSPTLGGTDVIDLKVGEERVGIDFTMRYVPTSTVSGQLIAPDGIAGEYLLRLIPNTSGEWTGEPEAALATTDANGAFVFFTIPAGSYVIQTVRMPQQQIGQQNLQLNLPSGRGSAAAANAAAMQLQPMHRDPLLWASAQVTVGGEDIQGVGLMLRPGFTVSGRMEFPGTMGRAKPDAQRMTQIPVTVEPADGRPGTQNGPPSRVLPDGRFITTSQQPGRYFVRVGGAPAGWMVQSVMINGIDASSVPVDLTQDVNNAVISFTDQIPDLRGSVTGGNPDDEPPAVIVFPTDVATWKNFGVNPARMRRATAVESTRSFGLGAMPPGDYFIIAIPQENSGDWQDPTFLEQLSRVATRFTLMPGEKRVMQLTVQDVRISRSALARPIAPPTVDSAFRASRAHLPAAPDDVTAIETPDGSAPQAAPPPSQQTRDTRAPAAAGLGMLSGVVMTDEDGGARPARLARVSVRGSALQGERAVMTDERGRYSVLWLPAGNYTIQVTKPAYLSMAYGARRPGRPGSTVTVESGKPLTDLNVTLPRGAAIGGIVLDHEGQPISNARVQILQAVTQEGQRVLNAVGASGQSTTDDRGAFRLYGLRPGNYTVMVTPPSLSGSEVRQLSDQELRAAMSEAAQAPTIAPASGRVLAPAPAAPIPPLEPSGRAVNYSPVFLPGTTSEADAALVPLAAGQEMTGLSIVMPLVPAARIEGVIVGIDGQPANNASVSFQRVMNAPGASTTSVRMMDGGRFFIMGVPPGQYTLSARLSRPGGPATPGMPPPSSLQLWAQETVYVSGVDQKELRLALQTPLTLTGRVIFEGGSIPPKTDVQVRLEQFVRPGQLQSTRSGRVEESGAFVFTNLTPGRYRLSASIPSLTMPGATSTLPPTAIWGTKSATLQNMDAFETSVEIGPEQKELTASVTVSSRLPELVGQIQNGKGELVTDMAMVLFSSDTRHWTGTSSRRLRSQLRPGLDGQFRFPNLLPGEYHLAVLTDYEAADLNDPAFMEQLVSASIKVTLAEGDKKVQAVRVAR